MTLVAVLVGCAPAPGPIEATGLAAGTFTMTVYVWHRPDAPRATCSGDQFAGETAVFPAVMDGNLQIRPEGDADLGFVATWAGVSSLARWSVSGAARDPQTGMIVSFLPYPQTPPEVPIMLPAPHMYGPVAGRGVPDGLVAARVQFTLNGATKTCLIHHFRLEPR
jgi:hypothetical protein